MIKSLTQQLKALKIQVILVYKQNLINNKYLKFYKKNKNK